MKSIVATLTAMALMVSPSLAGVSYSTETVCVTSFQDDTYGSGYDDPKIPNCVVHPLKPYAGGKCENVQQWTNYGGQNQTCTDVITQNNHNYKHHRRHHRHHRHNQAG